MLDLFRHSSDRRFGTEQLHSACRFIEIERRGAPNPQDGNIVWVRRRSDRYRAMSLISKAVVLDSD